jgi:UDP-glucose 4-epimerase
MRILITGGFGFIGGRLAQHLSNLGHEITLGSRKVKNPPSWLKDAKVALLDWNRPEALAIACKNIDLVIHAAGMNAQDSFANPISAHQFNGIATGSLINAAAKEGVKRFIYLSTAHVYSNPLSGIINEKTTPQNKHPYALSHLEGERLIRNCSSKYPIEAVIARLSNIYGPPAFLDSNCWNLFCNELCKQAIENGELRLNTNGTQKRDFLDISSACEMLSFLCERSIGSEKLCVFNVGTGNSQTLLEMAGIIQSRCSINFGFMPKIRISAIKNIDNNSDLVFNVDQILEAGYLFKDNKVSEIDNLLMYCKKYF